MRHVLLVEAADRPGLVHEISGVLFRAGLNLMENQEHVDLPTGRFFMRSEVEGQLEPERLMETLGGLKLPEAIYSLRELRPWRAAMLVSREHHCAADILVRNAYHELNLELVCVIGNHAELGRLVRRFEIPFHHLSTEGVTREEHEARLGRLLEEAGVELVILARYMRVLGRELVERWRGRMVNIHHSFLPAFVGARPYQQAFERGVKIIGATAHFVTEDLDEGPIIAQDVIHVDHSYSARDLARAGRDVEQRVLAAALRLVTEDRVMICGRRTVVFA